MFPSAELSSNNAANTRDDQSNAPKYRIDALPAELLKLIVVLVKEQDERLAQPPFRSIDDATSGIQALSRVNRQLRAAVIPFLCQLVTPNQLAHPLFQYGRIPYSMLEAVALLGCSKIDSTNVIPATVNMGRLPNLHAVRVDCHTWEVALGRARPRPAATEYDSDGEVIPPPPPPKPLGELEGQMAQEAFEMIKFRFSNVRLDSVNPASLDRYFSTFVDADSLRQLCLTPWSQFYNLGEASRLTPLAQCRQLVSLHLLDDGHRPLLEPEQPDFLVRLPSVDELSISSETPRVLRVIEHMTPNVRTLRLKCNVWRESDDVAPADLPHLLDLRLDTPYYNVTAIRAFVKCPYTSATWIDPKRITLPRLHRDLTAVLPLDVFAPTLRFLLIEAHNRPAGISGFRNYQDLCKSRGISFQYVVGTRAVGFFLGIGDDKVNEKATSIREVLRWAQDRVDWLERLGDGAGLQEMARLAKSLKVRQVVETA